MTPESENIFLGQFIDPENIFFGANMLMPRSWVATPPEKFSAKNWPVTFYISATAPAADSDTRLFEEALAQMRLAIDQVLATAGSVPMRLADKTKGTLTFEPADALWAKWLRFTVTETNAQRFEIGTFYPVGDFRHLRPGEFGCRITGPRVLDEEEMQEKATKEKAGRTMLERLRMDGVVMHQARITGDSEDGLSYLLRADHFFSGRHYYRKRFVLGLSVFDDPDDAPFFFVIMQREAAKDTDSPDRLQMSQTKSANAGTKLPFAPNELPEADGFSTITGVVDSYNINYLNPNPKTGKKDSRLTFVHFTNGDGSAWGSSVYGNDKVHLTRGARARGVNAGTPLLNRDIAKEILLYYPLGFKGRFRLDVTVQDNGFVNTRISPIGLRPGLKGRVSNDNMADDTSNRTLAEGEMMSPYCVVGGDILLVSDGFAAHLPLDKAPAAVRDYARAGLFNPAYRIAADVVFRAEKVQADLGRALEAARPHDLAPGSMLKAVAHSFSNGTVFLTTADGYPLIGRYTDDTAGRMLDSFGKEIDCSVTAVDEDGTVHVSPIFDRRDEFRDLDLLSGTIIYLDTPVPGQTGGPTYKGFRVKVVPSAMQQSKPTDTEKPHRVIYANTKDTTVCVAHCDIGLADKGLEDPTRLNIVPEPLGLGWWLCRTPRTRNSAETLNTYYAIKTNERGDRLLRHLSAMYDKSLYVMAHPQGPNGMMPVYVCRFRGQAACADYGDYVLNSEERPLRLDTPFTDETPVVMYHDLPLTAETAGVYTVEVPSAADRTSRSQGRGAAGAAETAEVTGTVAVVKEIIGGRKLRMALEDGGESITVTPGSIGFPRAPKDKDHLNVPFDNLFDIGSRWCVVYDDENEKWGLQIADTWAPRTYTIIGQRMRIDDSDWIVKGADLSIGVIQHFEGAEAGRSMVLSCDNSLSSSQATYLKEVEEEIESRIITVRIDDVDENYIHCLPVGVGIQHPLLLPKESMTWNPVQRYTDFSMLRGAAMKVRVRETDGEGAIILDRRSLLPECVLYKGCDVILLKKTHQMRVVDVRDDCYILAQNDFVAALPFDKASFCRITSTNFRHYLPKDSLIEVKISRSGGVGEHPFTADYVDLHRDIPEGWARYCAETDKLLGFVVTSVSIPAIVAMRDGVRMILNAKNLGLWRGTDLRQEYAVGDVVDCMVEKVADKYVLHVSETTLPQDVPQPGDILEMDRIIESDNNKGAVYASNGRFVAYIAAEDISWLPVNTDITKRYPAKRPFKVLVTEVNTDEMQIKGSIRGATDRPTEGIASESVAENPLMRRFTGIVRGRDGMSSLTLVDSEGYIGVLSDVPLEQYTRLMDMNGMVCLPVDGIDRKDWLMRVRPELLPRITAAIPVGTRMRVVGIGTDTARKAVSVVEHKGAMPGYIPESELDGLGTNYAAWMYGMNYVKDSQIRRTDPLMVEVIGHDPDSGLLIFSRRRLLAPGTSDLRD